METGLTEARVQVKFLHIFRVISQFSLKVFVLNFKAEKLTVWNNNNRKYAVLLQVWFSNRRAKWRRSKEKSNTADAPNSEWFYYKEQLCLRAFK